MNGQLPERKAMISRLTRILAVAALALAAAVLTSGAVAASHTGAAVKLRQSGLGRIVVDAHGRTLYLFTHDTHGKSTCYGSCAKLWRAYVTRGKPRALAGTRSTLLGTTRRSDGHLQVTYRRHPLYYYAGDRRAGQTGGRGLAAFGGRWYAVSAAGAAVKSYVMYPNHNGAFRRPKLRHGVLAIVGTKANDRIALRLKAGDPNVLQVDVGDDGSPDFTFKRTHIARIALDARAGDDTVRIDEVNGAFTDTIPTTIAGGDGNDTIAGGKGVEMLLGGAGNDTVDGNAGNDLALLGSGDDTFVWDPGDGSDVVEGQDGLDTMRFNGANIAEQFTLSANGSRLKLFRDIGNVTMDTAGVERVDLNTLGGPDLVTVNDPKNDLSGTDVTRVNVDLAGALGGVAGDGQVDRVVANGTFLNDRISVSGDASGVAVSGLRALVAIRHQEPSDQLTVDGRFGDDAIDAAGLAAGVISLTLDGETGDDTIAGGQGIETLLGGDGNDVLDGNKGNDQAVLGAGDDTFVWDPGDGSDVVEGQDGLDTMRFNGANIAEQFTLSANGSRFKLFRDIGNVTMDTAGVERVDVNTLGDTDLVTVNDLTGTDVTSVNVDLAGSLGGATGDGKVDRVVVNGTAGNDRITVNGDAGEVKVSGLVPTVAIFHPEADDRLDVNTLAGADQVDFANLAAGTLQLFVDGVQVP